MPIKINVPFHQKDVAKESGAVWLPDVKTWVIPDRIDNIDIFKAWLPQDGGSIVKYPYLIAKSSRTCWKCHKETPLIALAANVYFTTAFNSQINIKWEKYEYPVFFIGIKFIDNEVSELLKERFPFFRQVYFEKKEHVIWVKYMYTLPNSTR